MTSASPKAREEDKNNSNPKGNPRENNNKNKFDQNIQTNKKSKMHSFKSQKNSYDDLMDSTSSDTSADILLIKRHKGMRMLETSC